MIYPRPQHYVFSHDGKVWCETFETDGRHYTYRMRQRTVRAAVRWLDKVTVNAVVDSLDDPREITDAMRYAGSGW